MNRTSAFVGFVLAAVTSVAAQQKSFSTGFDKASSGELRAIETDVGRWTAAVGHAVIDASHHRSGRHCLHILGGQRRCVVLEPVLAGELVSELSFWCERWTRRTPFEFRVEQLKAGKWREIYRGDKAIQVGTFKSEVRIPIGGKAGKLRFSCTSPGGVLIDDVRFGRALPMRIASATVTQPVVPCLVGNATNTVARIELEAEGGLQPVEVREVHIDMRGTSDLADVQAVELITTDGGRIGVSQPPAETMVFRGKHVLREGRNAILISVKLAAGANIDHVVDAGCSSITGSRGVRIVPKITKPVGAQRCGVAVRRAGDDGSRGYRIPGVTTTNEGTLIAVYDVRWRGMGDLPGDIDVGMSRSVDGGRSWVPMKVILDMGKDPKFRFDGIGDPAILYDRDHGTIWVAATWSHGNRSWRGSGPGMTPEETGQLMLVRSDDDGVTWSKPINITKQVKRPEWCFLLPGPGAGICMQDGTLVFAAQFQDTLAKKRMPYATILYSRDHGDSWHLGSGPRSNTTEAQVVELDDGALMLNMRDNRGGSRAIYTTHDLGKTWAEHATSRRALIEPVCNAALLRVDKRALLFVNPAVSRAPRRDMTIKLSPDLGETWPEARQLVLDQGISAGYPSATMIDDEYIGVFFEGSSALLAFMRIPISDIKK